MTFGRIWYIVSTDICNASKSGRTAVGASSDRKSEVGNNTRLWTKADANMSNLLKLC